MTLSSHRPAARLLVFALLGASLFATPARAQVETAFGASLGASFSTLRADGASTGYRTGFLGGIAFRLSGGGPLGLQAEFGLAQRGTDVENDEGELRYGATYLELPVMLRVEAPSLGPVAPHAVAGGYGGVKVLERQSFGGLGANVSINTDESFFRRLDAGALVGLGAAVSTGTGEIEATVRYGHGLVNVARDLSAGTQPLPVGFPVDGQTRAWSIVFQFGL
jgi:hypothetical protein